MLSTIERKDALNAISGFMAGYGWVSFVCFFYLLASWAGMAPDKPDPAHGLIFPHNEHGSITYFSALQSTSCALLFGTSPLFFFFAVLISPKKEVVYKSKTLSFSIRWQPDDPRKIQRVGMALGSVAAALFIFLVGPLLVTYLNSIGFVTAF
jgi:hypothetical protein